MLELSDGSCHLCPSAHNLEAVVGVTFAWAVPLYTAVFACKTNRNRRTHMASSSAFLNFCELMILPGKVEADSQGWLYFSMLNTHQCGIREHNSQASALVDWQPLLPGYCNVAYRSWQLDARYRTFGRQQKRHKVFSLQLPSQLAHTSQNYRAVAVHALRTSLERSGQNRRQLCRLLLT